MKSAALLLALLCPAISFAQPAQVPSTDLNVLLQNESGTTLFEKLRNLYNAGVAPAAGEPEGWIAGHFVHVSWTNPTKSEPVLLLADWSIPTISVNFLLMDFENLTDGQLAKVDRIERQGRKNFGPPQRTEGSLDVAGSLGSCGLTIHLRRSGPWYVAMIDDRCAMTPGEYALFHTPIAKPGL